MASRGEEQRAVLIADIARFLKGWQRRLEDHAMPDGDTSRAAEREAERLRAAAHDLGLAGLARHLALCCTQLRVGPDDGKALRERLRTLSEVTWQVREQLRAAGVRIIEPAQAPAANAGLHTAGGIEPPRLLSGAWSAQPQAPELGGAGGALPSIVAPPLLSLHGSAPSLGEAARGLSNGGASALPAAPSPPCDVNAPPAPLDVHGGAVMPSAPLPALQVREVHGKAPAGSARGEPFELPPVERAAPAAVSPLKAPSPAVNGGRPPQLLGLQAFGADAEPAASQPGSDGLGSRAARAPAELFGFARRSRARGAMAPPPMLSGQALPALPGAAHRGAEQSAAADLDSRLRGLRRASGKPAASARPPSSRRARDPERDGAPSRGAANAGAMSWRAALIATLVIAVLAGGTFVVLDRRLDARAEARAGNPAGATVDERTHALSVVPGRAPEEQKFEELVADVQHLGGEASPELAALLEVEASATYRALSQPCQGAGGECREQARARELLERRPARPIEPRAPRPKTLPPRWLAGLDIPAIGAQDHPEVQRWLEYYTGHSVGRELFQTMLFRCGAYQDLIQKTLVHYGLPRELMAVVLTESACVPTAESGVGARGLWQFMAPTARAYHLHVQEGVVDERVSPVKSTEAAVRFLADLFRKMGSWDIALASYNAGTGPFRMLARMRQTGGQATFWDLAEAGLLPEETANYVPRIQAYALILANLRRFDFSTAQMRTSEETADLEVPSRTRLGQVARAAGTSVAYLRSLNPDLIGTVVPSLPGNLFVMQVPKTAAFRARDSLDQFLREDLDLCVSSAFDWGRERFTAAMQASCAKGRGGLTER